MIDSNSLYFLSGKFIIGALFFIRILGMFSSAPFFRNTAIPMQIKIILGVILAASMTSTFWKDQPVIDLHLWYMVLLVLKEFMTGIILGFSAYIVFWGARFAGGLIDFDMGYQTSLLFMNDENAPTLIGELYELTTLMIFLSINGHHFILEGLYASAKIIPLTTFEITGATTSLLINLITSVFIIGIKMAAPVLVALFLTNLALSLLSRIAPQTNIFALSFQLKVSVGLLSLLATVPLMVMLAKYALGFLESDIMSMLKTLNPGRIP